jgi:uncharacterized membrane protein YeiB
MHENRRALLIRAVLLLLMGILISPVWPGDILHFYAAYMAIGCCLLFLSTRTLFRLALLPTLIFALIMYALDFDRGWDWNKLPVTEIWNLPGVMRHLLFAGLYPVLPWLSFVLMGMCIGRQDLSDRSMRKRLMLMGACALAFAEGLSQAGFRLSVLFRHAMDRDSLLPWLAIEAWDPMPMFMLSAGGTALLIIMLCAALTENRPVTKWLSPLVAVGRCTLTLYVAHSLFGGLFLKCIRLMKWDTSLFPLWGTIFFYSAAIVFCHLWSRHHPRGPLEWLTRWFASLPWAGWRGSRPWAVFGRKIPVGILSAGNRRALRIA